MFANDQHKAIAYAAYKSLERMLNDDGKLPAGFYLDVSGKEITIKLPKGSVVEREVGSNGDGSNHKKATQNLYGYTLWALMIQRLSKFNQWNAIRTAMIDAMKIVVSRKYTDFRVEITKEDPKLVELIEELQNELKIPTRKEETPRLFKNTLPPEITIKG
jgi:hypothetical protein